MSVTTTTYTTNSKQITISNETGPINIMSAVDTAITGLGWAQYDYIAAGSSTVVNGIANTWSPVYTYVYRTLCADGTYYKYFIIRWNPTKSWFHTSVCESWNTSTHVPTNESFNFGMAFPQGYDLKDCSILVSATSNHLMIWPWIRGVAGLWAACFEFERVAAEDTTGVPCFAWTNSCIFGTPYGNSEATIGTQSTTYSSSYMLAFPRTANGNTGSTAASTYTTVTNRGTFPPNYPQGSVVITDSSGNALHLGSFYNLTYGWDNTKTLVSPISADGRTVSMPFGRGYNIGITKSFGVGLDTTSVNGSSTGGWPDNAGTSTDYLLLPLSGGCERDITAWQLNQAGRPSQLGYAQLGAVTSVKSVLIGNIAWIAASDGIRTWDSSQTAAGSTTTLRYSSASVINDIIFDGFRTVYAVNSTSIIRIDTETYNTGTVALTNGGINLGIDGAYVYAASRTASTAPNCYVINRWNTSDGSTGTGFTLQATYTLATTILTIAAVFGPPQPDYKGSCFVFNTACSSSTQAFRIAKFTSSTGAQLVNAAHPVTGSTASANLMYGNYWYNYISDILFFITVYLSTSQYVSTYTLNQSTLAGTVIQTTSAWTTSYASSPAGFLANAGELQITPYRGIFNLTNRGNSGCINKITLTDSSSVTIYGTNGTTVNDNSGAYLVNQIVGGVSSGVSTNGTSMVANLYVSASDNRIYYTTNLYNLNNSYGNITGRVLLKA